MTRAIVIFAFIIFGAASAHAGDEINLTKPGLFGGSWDQALNGYDTVSYHKAAKPVKGKEAFSTDYNGAKWLFASQENLDLFLAEPEKYAPQYGGHCAWAAGRGYVAPGSPKVYKIVEGSLYLNYDKSIAKKWEKDIPGFIESADKNWPELIQD